MDKDNLDKDNLSEFDRKLAFYFWLVLLIVYVLGMIFSVINYTYHWNKIKDIDHIPYGHPI